MRKKTTTREDFVTIKLYKYDNHPKYICPFKKNMFGTNRYCDYAYTEKCYTCDISKFAYEEWRKQ